MCFGPGYEILSRAQPLSPPKELVQQIILNQNVNYGNQQIVNSRDSREVCCSSEEINRVTGCDLVWDVIASPDNKVFTIIFHTNICTVDDGCAHSESKHSRFIVTKRHVIARCFSHTVDREVVGVASKKLRELFFPDDIDSFEHFMHNLFRLCNDGVMGRMNGHVWKVRDDKPWIYDQLSSYEDFVNKEFSGNPLFVKNPRKFADVVKYMESIDNPSLPFLRKDLDHIGFDNCVLNIITFEVSSGLNWRQGTVPRHNIDQSFSWDNLDTPLFDSLLQYQLGNGDVFQYFLGLIGRLLFAVKRFDNYNIVPIIKGDTGTGKSTVLEIVQKMFAPGTVGVLNTNNETTFGLQNKYNKELLIAHEIGDSFTSRLSSDLFKQMVCGEDVSVPRKNKDALDVEWRVPMLICSNVHIPYTDSQGSISRRLAIFKFDRYVLHKDVTLEARTIGSELPAIVGKCLLAYKAMLDTSNSFWAACPDYFHENTHEMSEQTDYIYMFLTLPPGDNVYGNKDVYFMNQPGAFMLLQDFKNKFTNYMRFRHPGIKHKWTSDYSALKRLGYDVEHINVCKGCGSIAKVGCCPGYNIANRSKRYFIKDLACIEICNEYLE